MTKIINLLFLLSITTFAIGSDGNYAIADVLIAGNPVIHRLTDYPDPQIVDLSAKPMPVKNPAGFFITMQNFNTEHGLAFVPADGGPNQLFLPDSKCSASNNQNWFGAIPAAEEDDLFLNEWNTEEGNRLHRFDRKEKLFTGAQALNSLVSGASFMFDGRTIYWTVRVKNTLMMLDAGDLSTNSIDLPRAFPVDDTNPDSTIYFNPIRFYI